MTTRPELSELILVAEARLVDLFPAGGAGRIEANGVVTLPI